MSTLTSLFLASADPQSTAGRESVIGVLNELDIIAEPLEAGVYRAGDGFSRHVVYAGCSPYLVMQPPADGSLQFCHVAVHGPFARPRLVTGPNTAKPRCPRCRARFEDWREQLNDWIGGGAQPHCNSCGEYSQVAQLDWRGHAISGRLLVELRNVFPGEASPSDRLMQELLRATGEAWQYAWAAYLMD